MYGSYWRVLLAAVAIIDQASLSSAARNKKASEILAQFDDTIQIFGEMTRNNIDFVDGLNIDVYSPSNRTLRVSKNMQPMTGRFVTGSNGGSYRGLTAYSYMLKTNDVSDDVIAKVEIPYDPTRLQSFGVDSSNAFVGHMASDNKSWVLQDEVLDVNKAAFKSRISKLTSLEGEFRLVGRVGSDVGNVFMPFGTGPSTSMQVWAGGRQEMEMVDGTRFTVLSETNLTMNVDIFSPVPADLIPQGMRSLYAFGYVVNTTQPAVLNVPAPAPGAPAASAMPGIPGAASPAPKASGQSVAPKAMSNPPLAGQASAAPVVSGAPAIPAGQASVAPLASGAPAASAGQAPPAAPVVSGAPAVSSVPAAGSQPAQIAGSSALPAVVSAASGAPNANPTIGGTIPQTLPALGAPGLPVNANPIPLMGGGLGPWGFFGPWGGVNNAPFKGPWKRSSPKMMRRQDVPASASSSALPPLPTVVAASSVAAAAPSPPSASAGATSFPPVAASEISAGANEPTGAPSPAAKSMATIAPPVASVPSAGQPAASAAAGKSGAASPAANSMATIAPPVASVVPSAGQPAALVPSAGQPGAPGPSAGQPAASASAPPGGSPAHPPVVPQPVASDLSSISASASAMMSASAKMSASGAQPPAVPAKTSSGAPAASASPALPPPGSVKEVTITFPINKAVLLKLLGKMPQSANPGNGQVGESPEDITDDMLRTIQWQVARRDVGANNQRFTPYTANPGTLNAANTPAAAGGMKLSINNGNLVFTGGSQLDGEYVVLIPAQTTTTQALSQAQKGTTNAAEPKGVESGHLVALAIVIFAALLV